MSAKRYRRGPATTLAAAGSAIGNATEISGYELVKVTGADGAKGVKLPVATAGGPPRIIYNAEAAQNLLIYPQSGAAIDAIAASSPFTLGGGLAVVFYPHASGQWYSLGAMTGVTAAELAFLDGATAGTPVASKAVVMDSANKLASLMVTKPLDGQGTPTAETGVATISIADILTGIVTVTHTAGATVALTLDTGAAMDTGRPSGMAADFSIDWTLINLSAAAVDTATVTASSGHTVVGTMICQSAHSSIGGINGNAIRLRSRRTAADTWITYRLA